MSKGTTETTSKSGPADLPAMRRRRDELEAEIERLEAEQVVLEKRVQRGLAEPDIQATARKIIAGEATEQGEPALVELARIRERLAPLARAEAVIGEAIAQLEYREAIEARLLPAFKVAALNIPKLAAALDSVELVLKEADGDLLAFEQAAEALLPRVNRRPAIKLPFDQRALGLLRFWRGDFLPESTGPLTPADQVRDALFMAPTRIERWKEEAAELGVKLPKPAVWEARSKGYVALPRPSIAGKAFVRLRTMLADAIGSGKPGQILEVSGDEAAALVDGAYAELVTVMEVNERLREFRKAPDGQNSEEEALADPVADAAVKPHLAGVASGNDGAPEAWTAEA